jgi:hypothetical protein
MSSSWRLTEGETYRIAYGVGGAADRRITRSVVVYSGAGERRRWDGRLVRCLEFALPRGRMLSLLEEQLVDARPALINDQGQLLLVNGGGARRRRILRRRLSF